MTSVGSNPAVPASTSPVTRTTCQPPTSSSQAPNGRRVCSSICICPHAQTYHRACAEASGAAPKSCARCERLPRSRAGRRLVSRVAVGGSASAMTPFDEGADRVGHGEAGLGEAQSSNPPDDPEMIREDAPPLDADVEYEGEGEPPEEPRDNEDPAPNAP